MKRLSSRRIKTHHTAACRVETDTAAAALLKQGYLKAIQVACPDTNTERT